MIVKTDAELQALIEIGRIVANTLKKMGEAIEPGLTTKELDEIGGQVLAGFGAKSAPISCYNFPGHTCISINEVVAHGIPGERIIKAGDKVNIDVSAVKDGFFGDNAATFLVPPIKQSLQKQMDCCQRALQRAISVAVAGYNLNGLGLAVEKEAHKSGFKTIRNLCGHGIGKALHDEPESIYNYFEKNDKRVLQKGMVLAVEPFISEHDQFVDELDDGWTLQTPNKSLVVQFEHTIVVTDDQPIILTLTD